MIKTLPENKHGRDFVIGDLHGCFDLLSDAMDNLCFDPQVDRIISVGDLIDRGPDSLKCLRLLEKPWFHCVKGNHEQLMEDWMTGGPTGSWWFGNGGDWFRVLSDNDKKEVVNMLPKVQTLPWIITVEGTVKFHVIHAEIDPSVTDKTLADPTQFRINALKQTADGPTCIWGRRIFGGLYQRNIRVDVIRERVGNTKTNFSLLFCGHTIMKRPVSILGHTNIDTGAFSNSSLCVTEPITGNFWITNNDGTTRVDRISV